MWIIILVVGLLLIFLYYKGVKNFSYWKERGVPSLKPLPFVGNYGAGMFKTRNRAYIFDDTYAAFPDRRYVGFYTMTIPILIVRDPELIKKLTIKEFDTFPQHRPMIHEDVDPLWNKNLFAMRGGPEWQDMRATLSPSFTSSRMRMMFDLIKKCAKQLTSYYLKQGGTVTLEMKAVFTKATNDIIASTAFGVTCDSLEHPDNEFYVLGGKVANVSFIRGLVFVLQATSPTLTKILNMPLIPKEVRQFFTGIISETIRKREEEGIVRPDMIHLLMEARKGRLKHDDDSVKTVDSGFAAVRDSEIGRNEKRQKKEITDDDILAQALVFFFGGFDTSSTAMCIIAYELAVNPDVQEKLHAEVKEALRRCHSEFTYEILLGMKYLDMVVSESLRKWPPNSTTDRESVKPITIEPELPGENPLYVESGTTIILPIYSIHKDPKYYPNPERFDPERFSEENKHNIISGTYLPFGIGPRSCIASRFALLETKLVIAEIISKFEIVPVEKTPIPILLSPRNFQPIPEEGFWLGLKPR